MNKILTDQEIKTDTLRRLRQLIDETSQILAQPKFWSKLNRIQAGIKAYTNECSICNYKSLVQCEGCIYGSRKSCLKMFWHPEVNGNPGKEDFGRALEFLNFLFPLLNELPDFVFGPKYVEQLRSYIEDVDKIFKYKYEKALEKSHNSSKYIRVKENNIIT